MSFSDYYIKENIYQPQYEISLKITFFVLMIIDILLSIFIGVRLSFGGKFKSHPYGLWSMMFFAQAMFLQGLLYTWPLQKGAQFILKRFYYVNEDDSFRIMQLAVYFQEQIPGSVYMTLECILYYDLYRIIYNPFYPTRNRFCLYYFLLVLVLVIHITILISNHNNLQF